MCVVVLLFWLNFDIRLQLIFAFFNHTTTFVDLFLFQWFICLLTCLVNCWLCNFGWWNNWLITAIFFYFYLHKKRRKSRLKEKKIYALVIKYCWLTAVGWGEKWFHEWMSEIISSDLKLAHEWHKKMKQNISCAFSNNFLWELALEFSLSISLLISRSTKERKFLCKHFHHNWK